LSASSLEHVLISRLIMKTAVIGQTINPPPLYSENPENELARWGAAGEQIDLMSGNLNFSLPIATAKSRGGWSANFMLSYNSQMWRKDVGILHLLGISRARILLRGRRPVAHRPDRAIREVQHAVYPIHGKVQASFHGLVGSVVRRKLHAVLRPRGIGEDHRLQVAAELPQLVPDILADVPHHGAILADGMPRRRQKCGA